MIRFSYRYWLSFLVLLYSLNFLSAFISPSTTAIVASSIGYLWMVIAAVVANFIIFFRKVKKHYKILVIIISFIIIISIVSFGYYRYLLIMDLNAPYDSVSLLENELDLNNLSSNLLYNYTIIGIKPEGIYSSGLAGADRSYMLSFNQLSLVFMDFHKFEEQYNLSKKDNILIICDNGHSSSELAEMFIEAGYNASFARMSRTHNEKLVGEFYNLSQRPSSWLIILPYKGEDNLATIAFPFIDYYSLEEEKYVYRFFYSDLNIENLEGKNIICFSNLHCALTKSFLDSHGIKNRKIYKISIGGDPYI